MVSDCPNRAALSPNGNGRAQEGALTMSGSQPIKKMKIENSENAITDQTSPGLTRSAQHAGVPKRTDENGLLGPNKSRRKWSQQDIDQ